MAELNNAQTILLVGYILGFLLANIIITAITSYKERDHSTENVITNALVSCLPAMVWPILPLIGALLIGAYALLIGAYLLVILPTKLLIRFIEFIVRQANV